MSIRERTLTSLQFVSGGFSKQEMPKDSVYHLLRLACRAGTFSTIQGSGGTGPTLVPGFPFSLMRQIRLVRNGSDVIVSGSGEQLAKHHYYSNNSHPFARLYTVTSNVETLRTATNRGVTVPANAQGIGANLGGFTVPTAADSVGVLSFDFQMDIIFQLGVSDEYFSTLNDVRKLSNWQIEIEWNTEAAQIALAGTTNGASTAAFSITVLSVDQDNVKDGIPYGTYKRSQYYQNAFPFGSENNQIVLPRGNLFYALMFMSKAYKAGSAVNAIAENSCVGQMEVRINTNMSLKKFTWEQIQKNNIADNGGRQNAFELSSGGPQGCLHLPFHNATQSLRELVPTRSFDVFDMQLSMQAIGSATNGVTTASTAPVIEGLFEEVIPGVTVSEMAPQGSQAGSIGNTNAGTRR